MKNHPPKKIQAFFYVLISLFIMAIIFTTTACASTSSTTSEISQIDKAKKLILGSWFLDFGYNPQVRADDQITFNKDGTIYAHHIDPKWKEWDEGKYSIENDENGKLNIILNITRVANHFDGKSSYAWEDVNVKIYYELTVTQDELIMYRYKRDATAMNWGIQFFDPAVINHFYRVQNGTKDVLTGNKWRVDSVRTPNCNWDEQWIFNEDGTMQSIWLDGDSAGTYNGTYDISIKDGITLLHQALDLGSGTVDEWWYEFTSCTPDLINVNLVKMIRNGEETDLSDDPFVNYYYKDIPLNKYTYHIKSLNNEFTFYDYWPKGKEYELFDLSKGLFYTGIPDFVFEQSILGIYENKDFTGTPLTRISAQDNTTDREFYIDWGLRCKKRLWDESKGKDGYNYGFNLPSPVITNISKIPAKGETLKILVSATVLKDFAGWGGPNLFDYSNNWINITHGWKYFETSNNKISEIFELKIDEDVKAIKLSDIGFSFGYSPFNLDEEITLTDVEFKILDDSEILEHTISFGETSTKLISAKNHDFILPNSTEVLSWDYFNWTLKDRSIIEGWYDNPEFKGEPISVYSAKENTKPRTFYGKRALKFGEISKQDDGRYYTNCHFRVKGVCPNAKINPKNGDIVPVYISGNCSVDYSGDMGLDISNYNIEDGWLGNDWHNVEIKDGKFETIFNLKIIKDANYSSIDDAQLMLAYHPASENEQMIIRDLKVVILDDTNFNTINYHFGDIVYTERTYTGMNYELPQTGEYFRKYDWNMGESYNIVGWYDNPQFTGKPITSISSSKNASKKDLWCKFIPKIRKSTWTNNDGSEEYGFGTTIPVPTVFPGKNFKFTAGTTVNIKMTATLTTDLDGSATLEFIRWEDNDWEVKGGININLKTENKKIEQVISITIENADNIKSWNKIYLNLGYNPDTYDGFLTFTDCTFELLD